MDIKENYIKLIHEIEKATHTSLTKPLLIAVSKTKPVEMIQELYDLGQRDFGENYAQELLEKVNHFQKKGLSDIRWHFIGALQSNKVKLIYEYIYMLHTLSSDSVLKELQKLSTHIFRKEKLQVFIQVNVDAEDSKAGCSIKDLDLFIHKVQKVSSVKLIGFMCIPDPQKNIHGASFEKMAHLKNKYLNVIQPLELSMGMSDDFIMAIQKGSTAIRLGSSIFGKREKSI